MSEIDAIANSANRFQGAFKRVLCVCSAGLLRSATAAAVFSAEPYNYNTRSCGVESYALIPLSAPLLAWADEIVCMGGEEHSRWVERHSYYKAMTENKPTIIALNIPDRYAYRNVELIELIKKNYYEKTTGVK